MLWDKRSVVYYFGGYIISGKWRGEIVYYRVEFEEKKFEGQVVVFDNRKSRKVVVSLVQVSL